MAEIDVIVPGPELVGEYNEKRLAKVRKEGGKKGVEIEGAADMGGLQYFCTIVDTPEGDINLLVEVMKAMNAKSDPSEEERKGGAGKLGKMIFNMSDDKMLAVAYIPKDKEAECNATEWLQHVLDVQCPSYKAAACEGVSTANYAVVSITKDSEKNIFPLKLRDNFLAEAYGYLRKKGLFPEDDGDDDDDFVFGDDDFP